MDARITKLEDDLRFAVTYAMTLKEHNQRYLKELSDLTQIIKSLAEENEDLRRLHDMQPQEDDVCRLSRMEYHA